MASGGSGAAGWNGSSFSEQGTSAASVSYSQVLGDVNPLKQVKQLMEMAVKEELSQ